MAAPVEKKKKPKRAPYISNKVDYFVFTETSPGKWTEQMVAQFAYYLLKKQTSTLEKLAVIEGKMRYFERRLKDGTILDLPAKPPRPFEAFEPIPSRLRPLEKKE